MPGRFTRQSFSLPPPMLRDLKRESEEKGISMSEMLRHYLRFGGLGQHKAGADLQREGGQSDDGS